MTGKIIGVENLDHMFKDVVMKEGLLGSLALGTELDKQAATPHEMGPFGRCVGGSHRSRWQAPQLCDGDFLQALPLEDAR